MSNIISQANVWSLHQIVGERLFDQRCSMQSHARCNLQTLANFILSAFESKRFGHTFRFVSERNARDFESEFFFWIKETWHVVVIANDVPIVGNHRLPRDVDSCCVTNGGTMQNTHQFDSAHQQ